MKALRTLTSVVFAMMAFAANAQEGTWNGELNVMGNKVPLVFNFSTNGCTIDSPSQGVNGIQAEKTVKDDGTISVKVGMIGATFEGKMTDGEIKGTYVQNGFPLPLTLKPGKLVVKRPQTPVPPFPYKEEAVSFTNAQYTFNGTLTLPENYSKNTPVVLMVTGSGQQNRDEELFSHKPFAVIADALARQGIASLRYDDRGWGDKSVNFADFTTDDFRQDAAAAIPLLRKRFNKVGILGHSEGGTIAMMLAAEGKADFIVSLAGMAISGKETLIMQNHQAMSAIGLPKETVDSYCNSISKALDEIASGKKASEINIDDVPQALKPITIKALQQADTPYVRHFLTVDVGKLLPKIKCPVLALNGTKDTQVDCDANTTRIEKGLANCKHSIEKIDGVNHLFQHCNTGIVTEYQQIEETIAPEVLQEVAKWIKANI
ncbi:alpha/beta hydrolase [Prevotella stercorea]|uniref:alpha/beta hydrolase n=1 Tax=Leyella stercorea TaxID=363265 RepID=UPI001F23A878|nr:alpha/beta hydrolase [Leyella stercorea]MCF2579712.1 alpha/beta hydrolase [Leyella stercorea]